MKKTMKKTVCLLLCAILGIGFTFSCAKDTSDICDVFIPYVPTDAYSPSDWAVEYVEFAYSVGIIDVKSEYRFTSPINRLEFCEMVFNAIKLHSGLDDEFDVPLTSPFVDTDSKAVTLLHYAGIINGKSAAEFKPDDFLTREEAATIIVRAVELLGHSDSADKQFDFKDSDKISDWAYGSVQKICNLGFMIGVGDNKFAPKDTYTAEQAVTTLVRVFKALKQPTNDIKSESFVATIIDEDFEHMVVEPMQWEKEYSVSTEIKVDYGTNHLDYLYGKGRRVVVYYDGKIDTEDGALIISDDISTEGFRDFELVVNEDMSSGEQLILTSDEIDELDTFPHNSDRDLHYENVNVDITVDGATVSLESAIRDGKITLDGIIQRANEDAKKGKAAELLYKDGGTKDYIYQDYIIKVYHTISGNRDVYIKSHKSLTDD